MAAGGRYSLYILGGYYADCTEAELATRLRGVTPAVPIIVFSTQVSERDREAALAAGASAFLAKPGGIEELTLTVAINQGGPPSGLLGVRLISLPNGTSLKASVGTLSISMCLMLLRWRMI
jgi:CheY-like chemotaxis protein